MSTLEKRLFSNMYKASNGCWIWLGATNSVGYGNIYTHSINGKTKTTGTHRASYIIHKGSIQEGKILLHSCDTPQCINPDHLSVGTQKDNIHDMMSKGRNAHGESLSKAIKAGWTPELRLKRSNQMRDRQAKLKAAKVLKYGANPEDKYCPRCDSFLPTINFNKNKARYDGLAPFCLKCRSVYCI